MYKLSPHWIKQLKTSDKPAYLLIADLIAEGVHNGQLVARDRLPPLRDLAVDLELNYTTVARAYAEARKRGLIDSHAGMGTFVRGRTPSLPLRAGGSAEMTMNLPPEIEDPLLLGRLRESAAAVLSGSDIHDLLRYQDFGGTPADRAAGALWLRQRLPACRAELVMVCPGIQSALVALISQLARPGELICVESLTYPGIKAIAAQLGVRLHALPLDEEGPDPDAFEEACKTLSPKAFYCNPTILNPTTLTVSQKRREALVDVALRFAIPIIEDDAYAMLPRQMPAPLAVLAPALTYYVTGFAKCLGAGLRAAYIHAPGLRHAERVAGALRATTVMASPITNRLATQWINDGTAQAMLQAIRKESMARQEIAARRLSGYAYMAQPEGFHLWLPLPGETNVPDFAAHLRAQGVGVVSSAAFSTDGDPPPAVRVSLGGPINRDQCDAALHLLGDSLTDALAAPHGMHGRVM
jgi:DNA-binding transcriptional MocR family regulator